MSSDPAGVDRSHALSFRRVVLRPRRRANERTNDGVGRPRRDTRDGIALCRAVPRSEPHRASGRRRARLRGTERRGGRPLGSPRVPIVRSRRVRRRRRRARLPRPRLRPARRAEIPEEEAPRAVVRPARSGSGRRPVRDASARVYIARARGPAVAGGARCVLITPVPIRPRRRGERRSLRTFSPGGVSLRTSGSLAFNPDTPRRLSTPLLTPFNSTPKTSSRSTRPPPRRSWAPSRPPPPRGRAARGARWSRRARTTRRSRRIASTRRGCWCTGTR